MRVESNKTFVEYSGNMHLSSGYETPQNHGDSTNNSHSIKFENSKSDSKSIHIPIDQADQVSQISARKTTCRVLPKIIFSSIKVFSKLMKILFTCIYTVVFVPIGIVLAGPVATFSCIKYCFVKCFSRKQCDPFSVAKHMIKPVKNITFHLTFYGILLPITFPLIILHFCFKITFHPFNEKMIEKLKLMPNG